MATGETVQAFHQDTFVFELAGAAVLACCAAPPQSASPQLPQSPAAELYDVVLDKTLFYPGGGGQPCDTGVIVCEADPAITFLVQKATNNHDGVVHHLGSFSSGSSFAVGATVKMTIDKDKRILHAKLHTGGHLLDACMTNIGYPFLPTKGMHYPSGTFVGYAGQIPADQRPVVIQKLNEEAARQIALATPVRTELLSPDEVVARLGHLPEYLPKDKPSRFVTVADQKVGYPCAGTHLHNLGELKSLTVTKIARKSGETHVSYKVV
eukprot:TRINITY_DN5244_c2_g1_i1.p1 TRINITY_DN5244_c2_g1~~TRINITY_DN5244_c2_g1_i1.p1  ORF type:complete len:266 (+),score=56.04 TRINITY_DN5244_c2_g1_i1:596-1393(+)